MSTKLAIGPANYAGQASAWTRAVVQHLGIPAWSFSGSPLRGSDFRFEVDTQIDRVAFRNPIAWSVRARRMLGDTTHVALDGFKSFHRWDRHAALPRDARRLESLGYRMALIAHGSDVRDPAGHLARNEWSYFATGDDEWRAIMATQARRNREFAVASGWPIFFSTPDLAADLPSGTWLPVVVDVDQWRSDEPLFERERPLVVHVPSRRHPPIKGTQLITPVLQKLHDEGIIEYVAPGPMPNAQLRNLVRRCDVLVDQLLFGSYGVAAVEGMAAGRVTVGTIAPAVRQLSPEWPQLLEATPETLRDVICSARERRQELREQAEVNLKFVHRWHSGEESARRLRPFLDLGRT